MDSNKDYGTKAREMWATFTDNEKTGIRFGMFPAVKIQEAEAQGFTDGRLLCVALMDCAKHNGGMRA